MINYLKTPNLNVVSPYGYPGGVTELKPECDESQEIDPRGYLCDFFIEACSEKQTLRPDPFCSSVCAVTPTIGSWFTDIVTRVEDTFGSLFFEKRTQVVENDKRKLDVLNSLIKDEILLNDDNLRLMLSKFVANMLEDPDYTKELKKYLDSTQKDELRKLNYLFRLMLKPRDEDILSILEGKIFAINEYLSSKEKSGDFPEDQKLTPKEYGLLYNSKAILNLLTALKKNQISFPNMDDHFTTWRALGGFYESSAIDKLRSITTQSLNEGDILIVDRLVRQELSDSKVFNAIDVLKHLVGGRLAHIAIYVNNSLGLCLSHVNNETNRHSFKVIQDPLYYQFLPSLKLNITSLLPPEVSDDDKSCLNEYFCRCFAELAKIERPDIPLAQFSSYAKFFFCGHEGILKNKNDDPEFETQQGEMCSSYVAKVFLQALNNVNQYMCELGYKKTMPNPFSDYEILERMDILRLLFHWNKFQICSLNPVDPIINSVLKIDKSIKIS